jgi:hypothetical protein
LRSSSRPDGLPPPTCTSGKGSDADNDEDEKGDAGLSPPSAPARLADDRLDIPWRFTVPTESS